MPMRTAETKYKAASAEFISGTWTNLALARWAGRRPADTGNVVPRPPIAAGDPVVWSLGGADVPAAIAEAPAFVVALVAASLATLEPAAAAAFFRRATGRGRPACRPRGAGLREDRRRRTEEHAADRGQKTSPAPAAPLDRPAVRYGNSSVDHRPPPLLVSATPCTARSGKRSGPANRAASECSRASTRLRKFSRPYPATARPVTAPRSTS